MRHVVYTVHVNGTFHHSRSGGACSYSLCLKHLGRKARCHVAMGWKVTRVRETLLVATRDGIERSWEIGGGHRSWSI